MFFLFVCFWREVLNFEFSKLARILNFEIGGMF